MTPGHESRLHLVRGVGVRRMGGAHAHARTRTLTGCAGVGIHIHPTSDPAVLSLVVPAVDGTVWM